MTDYTPDQLIEIGEIGTAFAAADYPSAYRLLADFVETHDLGSVETVLWLRGAADVNENTGTYADFIRGYSKFQYQYRYGETLSDAALDSASDNLAISVIGDFLDSQVVPSLAKIENDDSDTIASELFGGDKAGWAGNPLFLGLGRSQALTENILSDPGDTYDALAMIKAAMEVGGTFTNFMLNAWDQLASGSLPNVSTPAQGATATNAFLAEAYGFTLPLADAALLSRIVLDNLDNSASLSGTGDDDYIHAGNGDDTIIASGGLDIVDGGKGSDTIDFSGYDTDQLNVTIFDDPGLTTDVTGSADPLGDTARSDLFNIERIIGSNGNDRFLINNVVSHLESLDGGAGDDDQLSFEGVGQAIIFDDIGTVSSGGTTFTVANFEGILGSGHDDVIRSDGTVSFVDGKGGYDKADYSAGTSGLTFSLDGIGAQDDMPANTIILKDVEELTGTASSDTIFGSGAQDVIRGNDGDDFLDGSGIGSIDNIDTYFTEQENSFFDDQVQDRLEGGLGNDFYFLRDRQEWRDAVREVSDPYDSYDGNWSSFFDVIVYENYRGSQYFHKAIDTSQYTDIDVISDADGIGEIFVGSSDSYWDSQAGASHRDVFLQFSDATYQRSQGNTGIFLLDSPNELAGNASGFVYYQNGSLYGFNTYQNFGEEFYAAYSTDEGARVGFHARFVIENFSNGDFGIYLPLPIQGSDQSDNESLSSDGSGQGQDYDGNGGNDTVQGSDGNDRISGGTDNDTLFGAEGDDFVSGDEGDDVADGGDGDDRLDGGSGSDDLSGGDGDDHVFGGAGDDVVAGGAGNDELGGDVEPGAPMPQAGNDLLIGGSGHDTYHYTVGGGNDTIREEGPNSDEDGLILYGLATNDISVQKTGPDEADLLITISSTGETILVENQFLIVGTGIEYISFTGNTSSGGRDFWDRSEIETAAEANTPQNTPPEVAVPLSDQNAAEDAPWTFTVPASTFSDADGDALAYGASLADGSALPAWLAFDADTRTFSGTPPLDFNGTLSLKVTASDGTAGAEDIFDLAIAPVNDAPILDVPIADQNAAEDAPWTFTVPVSTFSDADGDALAYGASLADGSALPAWLAFDADTRTFSGTPPLDFNGTLSLKVTASDGTEVAEDIFDLAVAPVNDPPAPMDDTGLTTVRTAALIIPADTLLANDLDVDGDTLTIVSVASPSDGSLALNQNGDVVFTPSGTFVGIVTFEYTVSDGTSSATASVAINLTEPGATPPDDVLNGTAGDDVIDGLAGDDVINGLGGNDILTGGAGADELNGGDGDDTIHADAADLWFGGGSGTDTLIYEGADDRQYSMAQGSFEQLTAGSGNNTVWGTADANTIDGGSGDDTLHGYGGNDTLIGGAGADSLMGGDGDDIVYGDSDDVWFSGDGGEDTLIYTGTDALSYALDNGEFEHMQAGSGNNSIYGSAADNIIDGEAGDDLIQGYGGNDILTGGTGADVLQGGDGDDIIFADADDTWFSGDAGTDTLVYSGQDDRQYALDQGAFERVEMGSGDNTVWGSAADDIIDGQGGTDTLFGYAGADRIIGGSGSDFLVGGTGSDTFVFNSANSGHDTITDFAAGADSEDMIEFSTALFGSFSHVLTTAIDDGTSTTITIDTNTSILLENITVADLHQDDFLFV